MKIKTVTQKNVGLSKRLILLMLALALMSGMIPAAYAEEAALPDYSGDWISFRGNEQNMGITEAKTPVTAEQAKLKWGVQYGSSWADTITPPLSVNGFLYVAKNMEVLKIDPENGEIMEQSEPLAGKVGYALNPITYGGGMFFVPIGNGQIQALRADTLESVWVSEALTGQTLTPITYKNGYVYTGTYSDETGEGLYFCLSTEDEDTSASDEIKTPIWTLSHIGGFYWAGAYATDDYMVFGSDDGASGSETDSAVLYSVSPLTGTVIDTISGITGDIRSTVSYDADTDRIYFSTKGGEFYQVRVNVDGSFAHDEIQTLELDGMSMGTPLIYDGLAYLGVSGISQFSPEGHKYKVVDVTVAPMKEVAVCDIPGYVQTSALLSNAYMADTNKVYVYTTYNYTPGGIYVIEAEKSEDKDDDGAAIVSLSSDHLFIPESSMANYCICSLVCDTEGVIYYKNDSGYLMAVSSKLTDKTITSFKIGEIDGTINEDDHTISLEVSEDADVSMLIPEISIGTNATVSPESGVETDFSLPVIYTVTAEDGTEQEYNVTVTKPKSSSVGGGTLSRPSSDSENEKKASNDKNIIIAASVVPVLNASEEEKEEDKQSIVFDDVNDTHWAKEYISYLTEQGIVKGKTEKSFAPEDKITRAEFIGILYRISGEKKKYEDFGLDDVKPKDWFYDAVSWGIAEEITSGTSQNTFSPDADITREQMATMLLRFSEYMGHELSEKHEYVEFDDVKDISDYARKAVETMQRAGIITGRENNMFEPKGSATRAEAAKILALLMQKFEEYEEA